MQRHPLDTLPEQLSDSDAFDLLEQIAVDDIRPSDEARNLLRDWMRGLKERLAAKEAA